ncbi:MAG: hypothetical protein HRU38_21560 [Saccharospirillaceae bacterium]|nr:hypothetical protein [Pseudomonadales bacterium]NRB81218.1 hypothetical protein [Saccharospirillaceae bacterium]
MLHKNIIKIRDENLAGQIINEIDLTFDAINVSILDIITQRVLQEVESYNLKSAEYTNNLVQPTDMEIQLNNSSKRPKKLINAEEQIEVALNAFQNNGFFILINNYQAETLEERVVINDNQVISFMKLTPLVGG